MNSGIPLITLFPTFWFWETCQSRQPDTVQSLQHFIFQLIARVSGRLSSYVFRLCLFQVSKSLLNSNLLLDNNYSPNKQVSFWLDTTWLKNGSPENSWGPPKVLIYILPEIIMFLLPQLPNWYSGIPVPVYVSDPWADQGKNSSFFWLTIVFTAAESSWFLGGWNQNADIPPPVLVVYFWMTHVWHLSSQSWSRSRLPFVTGPAHNFHGQNF